MRDSTNIANSNKKIFDRQLCLRIRSEANQPLNSSNECTVSEKEMLMTDQQQTALSKPYGGTLDQLGKVESARQAKQLQEVLLDSVMHEQRTSLTSINTCVTALLTIARLGPTERNELLTIINEETDRLNYLERARLDIGEIINLEPHAIEETIDAAKQTAGRCSAHIQFRRRSVRGCRFAVQYCERTLEVSVEKSTFVDSSTA
jgi:K+-sensing histidine kinase KdpD